MPDYHGGGKENGSGAELEPHAAAGVADEIVAVYADIEAADRDELPPTPRWMLASWTPERRGAFERAGAAGSAEARARSEETEAAVEAERHPSVTSEVRLLAATARRRAAEVRARRLVGAHYAVRRSGAPRPTGTSRPRAPRRHRRQRAGTGVRASRDGPPEPPTANRLTRLFRLAAILRLAVPR